MKPIAISAVTLLIFFFLFSDTLDYCSHFQTFRYWSKSLTQKRAFPAKRCRSWNDFKSGRCNNNPTNYMGYDADPTLKGVFFNEIITRRNLFEDANAPIFDYIATSFVKRSDIAKLLKRFGVRLS